MLELSGLTPDCFDCGMRVTVVEVRGSAAPFEVTIGVRFDPYTGDEVEESFTLSVDDPPSTSRPRRWKRLETCWTSTARSPRAMASAVARPRSRSS